MASKNIAITEELYHELEKRKSDNESFTKVIFRLLEKYDKPSNYFGYWKDLSKAEEQKLKKARSELRELWTGR
jgi:predicted CopG family antitoxin